MSVKSLRCSRSLLAALWGATQWAASALGYQAALGPAWFTIAGYPVYLPWRLFEWWYVYDAYAPHVFEQAGAIAAFASSRASPEPPPEARSP